MTHAILITAPYMLRERGKIEEYLKTYPFQADFAEVEERLEEGELLPIIASYDGILCGDDRITKKVIDAATRLKAIVKWGTGIDAIDTAYAESKGIRVARTPNAFTEPVSDTTLALMLAHVRRLRENDEVVKSGRWDKPQGYLLREKTVGIIGFGDIGQAVARKLISFGPVVLANDIKEMDGAIFESLRATSASKEQIYERCDIITLHCDLNQTSRYILDREAFSRMKKKPYIINTARGPIIREADLVDALRDGRISGAGLDVFESEPLPAGSALRSLDIVTASCHNSNSSPSCWDRVHRNSLELMKEALGA